MAFDRHTSGDEFDRSEDVRVENAHVEDAKVKDQDQRRDDERVSGPTNRKAWEAMQVSRQAGQGIIWSLLAVGLAACGGGTNYVLRPVLSGDPDGSPAGKDHRRRRTD